MLSTKIFTLLLTVAVAKHHRHHHHKSQHHSQLAEILRPNNNFFGQLAKTAQGVVNGMFNSLNLSEQFAREPKIKLLLKMQHDLNNISEKNFESYNVLRNASAVTADNKPINQIRLIDFIIGILNKKEYNTYNKSENVNTVSLNTKATSTFTNKTISSEFANSEEFKRFIQGFIGKLKRLTVDDLFKKKNKTHSKSKRDQLERDYEIWKAPKPEERALYNNNNQSRRIFGGKKTKIFHYPFIVSIHILEEFTCAGSIISKDLVLTAASCLQIHHNNRFFRENPRTTYVRVGSDWTSRRGEIIPVLEIYFHPQYDPKSLNHNLAIIRLKRLLDFKRRRKTKVRRILLDTGDGNLAANTAEIEVLGWGAKKANQIVDPFEKLSYAVLSIYHIKECKEIYSKEFVTENHFCAGFVSRGGGACNRDVGGPAIVDSLLVGVISFGAPVCGAPDAPTVFTRVGHYLDWIERIMALQPVVYGVATTSSPNDKFLIYYNTRALPTHPRMHPIPKLFTRTSTDKETYLARAHDTQEEELDETVILSEIVNNNDMMVHDVINHDLYNDFNDIIRTKTENNASNQSLRHEIEFTMSSQSKPTSPFPSTNPLFSRPQDEYNHYDVYGAS